MGKFLRLGLAPDFCYDVSLWGKFGLKTQKKKKKVFIFKDCHRYKKYSMIMNRTHHLESNIIKNLCGLNLQK